MSKMKAILTTLFLAFLSSACGAPFTGAPDEANIAGQTQVFEPSSGASGAEPGGASNISAGAPGAAGLPGTHPEGGGGSSNGGGAPTAGSGEGGSLAECLGSYERSACGDACTGSAYPGCRRVLECMIEKNVKAPATSLDPCYVPDYYTETEIALRVYQACCN